MSLYKSRAFNVHYREIGNEVDVDPTLVLIDSGSAVEVMSRILTPKHRCRLIEVVDGQTQ